MSAPLATVVSLAPYRMPRLDGLSVLVRGERVELDGVSARLFAEALLWAHQAGARGQVAGITVTEARGGIHLELPGGALGLLPRKLVVTWIEVLHQRAELLPRRLGGAS
ncbi:MAG TPA: hypothetical protein VLC09_00755 [Polyangiaceae bacterium]|nr:hypothetical protein [Polyangiaceae bacterium]